VIKIEILQHRRKASSLARRYKFPLILSATLPPSQGSFVPKLDVSSLCLATAYYMYIKEEVKAFIYLGATEK
jgi:hypothetical protein